MAFNKFGVAYTSTVLVGSGCCQHFIGHIQAVGFTVGTNPLGGEQHI